MSDLISRQAAIEAIKKYNRESDMPEDWHRGLKRGINIIKKVPSAEAVQVVMCKECKHRDLFSCPLADNDFQKDDDFCSWGERKGGEDE